jgi:hypothetical protein
MRAKGEGKEERAKALKIKSLSSLQAYHNTKTEVIVAVVWRIDVTEGGATVDRIDAPRAATQYARTRAATQPW